MSFTPDYLLIVKDVEGSESENSRQIIETYYLEYSKVQYGYDSNIYPQIGDLWKGSDFAETTTKNYYCSSIQFTREAKRFYSGNATYSTHNGKEVVEVKATYTLNFNKQDSAFTKRISGSGYKTFKINNGGAKWLYTKDTVGTQNPMSLPVAENQVEFEYKVPISQIDLKTNFIGNIDEVAYDLMRNKINDSEFLGRAKGTVLFDSYTITPKINGDVVKETELTLTFKCLANLDWNVEFRNKCYALNSFDNKKLYWQDKDPDRCDYIYNYTEVSGATPYSCYLYDCVKSVSNNTPTYYTYAEIKELIKGLPIWSGAMLRVKKRDGTTGYNYERIGNYDLSTEGFDVRYWLKNPANGDTISNRQYLYDYGDFDSLLTGFPIINEYEEPEPTENDNNNENNDVI